MIQNKIGEISAKIQKYLLTQLQVTKNNSLKEDGIIGEKALLNDPKKFSNQKIKT